MKKATMQNLANFVGEWIEGEGGREFVRDELTTAYDELIAELNKGKEKKDATATAYAEMWEKVRQALTDATAPVTAQEIADETGLTRGKIVYGLTNYWANEVVKDTSGKSTTYALKA